MFTNQDIIFILFRLINFAALMSIAFILFKRHILPDLLLSMARKKNKQDSLYARQAALEKQQSNLDTLLKDESLQCEAFRSKIDIWKEKVTLEYEHHQKIRDDLIKAVNKRSTDRTLQREHDRVQTIVTRAVVTDVQKSLSLYFQKPPHGDDYLNSILHFMNERKS